ncbi:hypothetical protein DESC_810083 [Desulfosarcina cetonica]|uniref:hypothetical protein n=1 Tax=Desulfosarcina cetonica TaxID=90730 RepID=UPI0006D19305|nr:hypothetical protein [Desulfosarcina cetonica]VTR70512.1 hypothetical protein DESC_810083 [Desulfosarcina cetonica]
MKFIDDRSPTELIQSAQEYNTRIQAMLVQLKHVFDGLEDADRYELYAINLLCERGVEECALDASGVQDDLDKALMAMKGGAHA